MIIKSNRNSEFFIRKHMRKHWTKFYWFSHLIAIWKKTKALFRINRNQTCGSSWPLEDFSFFVFHFDFFIHLHTQRHSQTHWMSCTRDAWVAKSSRFIHPTLLKMILFTIKWNGARTKPLTKQKEKAVYRCIDIVFQMKCHANHKCLLIRQQRCFFIIFMFEPNMNRCVVLCSSNEHWTPPQVKESHSIDVKMMKKIFEVSRREQAEERIKKFCENKNTVSEWTKKAKANFLIFEIFFACHSTQQANLKLTKRLC